MAISTIRRSSTPHMVRTWHAHGAQMMHLHKDMVRRWCAMDVHPCLYGARMMLARYVSLFVLVDSIKINYSYLILD